MKTLEINDAEWELDRQILATPASETARAMFEESFMFLDHDINWAVHDQLDAKLKKRKKRYGRGQDKN